MEKLLALVFKFMFEKLPVLNWVNGHKRTLSRVVGVVGVILMFAQENYPHLSYLKDVNFWFVWLVAQLGLEVGVLHAKIKGERKGL